MSEHKAKRKKSLLDDDDAVGQRPTNFGIRVNKEFAARFEHNKRREELHRLQSKYPEEAEKLARKIAREAALAAGEVLPPNDDADSSEEEEEDDGEIPVDTEAKIFETLLRIRNQDPAIYQKDVQFFEEPEDEAPEEPGSNGTGKKAKPMYLKDFIAKQALEYGPGADSSDDELGDKEKVKRHPKAYDREQEDLRKAFLVAATEAEAEEEQGLGGVLRLRPQGEAEEADHEGAAEGVEQMDADSKKKRKKGLKNKDKKLAEGQFQQLIDAYFGTDEKLNPDDKFLKEYIVNKGWVDRDDDYVPSYHEIVGDDDGEGGHDEDLIDDEEDEKYLRQSDVFEAKYNFRYEEPGADRIITHPRIVEGTIRKPDDTRKRQRDNKKQRIQEAEEAAREEVKRLKNLKKQEIESKLDKLRTVAGAAAPAATSLDDMLEGDFDPEEWDKKMAAAFDNAYYDVSEELDDLQEDLDLLGDDMDDSDVGDAEADEGGDGAVRFTTLRKKLKEVDALSEESEDGGGDGKGSADPEVMAKQRAELQRLLEAYYKLDYEDNVGGIKTRFRYKEVPRNNFGLSVDDILRLDDKALNQVVGMKRLAPYREDTTKLRPNYKALEMIKGEAAYSKQHKRQYKKREWQKDQQRRWRSGSGDGEAAGLGPGSATAAGEESAGKQQQAPGRAGVENAGPSLKPKRKEQNAGDGGNAGPGPGSQASPTGERHRKKQKLDHGPDNNGPKFHDKRQKPKGEQALDPQQARLASYAVPTLKKDGAAGGHGGASKKRKRGDKSEEAPPAESPGAQLSRAQKKNMKRAQKRASKRESEVAVS